MKSDRTLLWEVYDAPKKKSNLKKILGFVGLGLAAVAACYKVSTDAQGPDPLFTATWCALFIPFYLQARRETARENINSNYRGNRK